MDEPRAKSELTPGSIGTIRVFGVPVRLHFTFVLLLVFLIFIGIGGHQSGLMTALYIAALFASVLLHEIGHALVARRFGIRTVEIVMYPIGGVSRPERAPKPKEELWVALVGPLINLVIGAGLLIWVSLYSRVQLLDELRLPSNANLLERIGVGNLLLGLFNLLPAYPMDGGRVLRAFFALHRSYEEATRIASGAGQTLAVFMGLAGLLSGNFMLIFIALFVYLGASQEGAAARGRLFTTGYPVSAAMITDYRTLKHGDTIRDAGNLLLATSQHDFPVMHGDVPIGVLTRSNLVRGMMSDGPDAYVSNAMNRDFLRLDPSTPLTDAVTQLSQPGAVALVMDGENHLAGMLTPEHLSEFILLQQVKQKAQKELS